MPLPRDETTPPVTKTYFVGRVTRLPPEAVELAQDRRPLDQLAEGAQFAEEGEPGQRADRQPAASSREPLHGIQP